MKKTSMQVTIDTEWERFSITRNFDPIYGGIDYTATVLTKNEKGDTCWYAGRHTSLVDAIKIMEDNIAKNDWHIIEKVASRKPLSDMF